MKVTTEEYDEIFWDDAEGFTMIQDGEWEADGKYQDKRVVVQHNESGKFYALYRCRSGSPFSEYYYEDIDTDNEGMATLDEVFPHTKTVTVYK